MADALKSSKLTGPPFAELAAAFSAPPWAAADRERRQLWSRKNAMVASGLARRRKGGSMLETVPGAAEGVIAYEAVGKITSDDYRKTLEPAVEALLAAHDGLRVVLVLGNRWEGMSATAVWDDLRVGLSKFRKWKRCAVVTNRAWIEHATKAFGWLTPGEVKVFELDELHDALAWAAADD
jgi:hypothetical protein